MGSPLSLRFAVGGFALGLILALSPSCTPPACNTSNCAGCCDATGTCQTGTDSNACGVNGTACGVCSGAQSCSGRQCGSGGGNGGGAGGGGGSAEGSFARFCQSFAAAYCDGLVSCGSLDTTTRNACVNYIVGGDCYVATPSHIKGYSTFVPGAAAACLASVQAEFASCLQPSFSCVSDALAPAAGLGQACIDNSDCKDPGTACGGANICGRTCQVTGGLNQPCGVSFPACNANLYCDQSQTCRAVKTAGATCANPGECDANSYCDSTQQRCIALPTNGQSCQAGFPKCAGNAWCDSSVTPNLCRSRAAVGQSCATSQCVSGAWCNTATNPPSCAALKNSGQPCGSGSECANARCTSAPPAAC